MSDHEQYPPGSYNDPDRYIFQAKELVRDNYNAHQDDAEMHLTVDDLHIVYFTKALSVWRAWVASSVVRGLEWKVTYTGMKGEAYIEVFRKINNARIVLRRNYGEGNHREGYIKETGHESLREEGPVS